MGNIIVGGIRFIVGMGVGSAVTAMIKYPEGASKFLKLSIGLGGMFMSMYAADKIVSHVETACIDPIRKALETKSEEIEA